MWRIQDNPTSTRRLHIYLSIEVEPSILEPLFYGTHKHEPTNNDDPTANDDIPRRIWNVGKVHQHTTHCHRDERHKDYSE